MKKKYSYLKVSAFKGVSFAIFKQMDFFEGRGQHSIQLRNDPLNTPIV